MIAIIAAIANNGAIGHRGGMPWNIPEDLAHFKVITKGHAVLMGRRTHESIGRALPGRRNIVVTRGEVAVGCERVSSLAEGIHAFPRTGATFVIGGVGLFTEALPLTDRIYITELSFDVPADTFWRPDLTGFTETFRRPGRTLGLSFVTYSR